MDNWKAKQIANTLNDFFTQFGELDQYSRVVLEIIFGELHGTRETISISDEKRQNGNEIIEHIPIDANSSSNKSKEYKNNESP